MIAEQKKTVLLDHESLPDYFVIIEKLTFREL